jgi:hypothetical protein
VLFQRGQSIESSIDTLGHAVSSQKSAMKLEQNTSQSNE